MLFWCFLFLVFFLYVLVFFNVVLVFFLFWGVGDMTRFDFVCLFPNDEGCFGSLVGHLNRLCFSDFDVGS